MSTTITVDIDISGIEERYSEDAVKSAQRQVAMRIGTDSNRYCKWDTGATYNSMVPNSDFEDGEIRWSTPYASDAYNNPNVGTHPTVPNGKTDPHAQWFEVAKSRHFSQWLALAERLLKK